jgi:hypothetical protein
MKLLMTRISPYRNEQLSGRGGSYTFIYFELRVQWRLCVAIFEENSLKM